MARYTHRAALSNRRLLCLEAGRVTFRYKDYRRAGVTRTLTLEAAEFTRRFLLHVLPKGFVRIRSFGFLAHRDRNKKLALCRLLLNSPRASALAPDSPTDPSPDFSSDSPFQLCPNCQQGRLLPPEILLPETPQRTPQRSRAP